MRIQLTVQRHGIPSAHVLWTVGEVRPPLAAAGTSCTISQLLEQVNDIIPLESDDWGLEDYAVDVRGFECLHFSEVDQVLKEDDEVCIRPLQTSDLRVRKISGRRQISADGKHLIDGVVFGLPLLRKAPRPMLHIPARKKRTLLHLEDRDEIDVHDGHVSDCRLMVRAGFKDADGVGLGEDSEGESEDDEYFAPEDGNSENMSKELEDLRGDVQDGEAVHTEAEKQTRQGRSMRSQKAPARPALLDLLDQDGKSYPGAYSNPLLDYYSQFESHARSSSPKASKHRRKITSRDASGNTRIGTHDSSMSPESLRPDSLESSKSGHFDEAKHSTPAHNHITEDSDDDADSDCEPGGAEESDTEKLEPEKDASDLLSDSRSACSFGDDETSSSGTSSSESESDSDSDSDSELEKLTSSGQEQAKGNTNMSSSTTTSSSSNSSNSSSGARWKFASSRDTDYNAKGRSKEIITDSQPKISKKNRVPGEGMTATRKRNQRRKECKALAALKQKGILSADASRVDLRAFKHAGHESPAGGDNGQVEKTLDSFVASDHAMEAKKKALLDRLSVGEAYTTKVHGSTTLASDKSLNTTNTERSSTSTSVAKTQPTGTTQAAASETDVIRDADHMIPVDPCLPSEAVSPNHSNVRKSQNIRDDHEGSRPDQISFVTKGTAVPTPDPQQRRAKLDLASSQRLLFGSLGLRTPKSKDDASNLRAKLMKDVKPVVINRTSDDKKARMSNVSAVDDESWRAKIDLRAVECCQDGIELSTPPFPFIQRWDPQQRNPTQSRKNKKRKRNNDSFYDSNQYDNSLDYNFRHKVQRQEEYDPPHDQAVSDAPVLAGGSQLEVDSRPLAACVEDAQQADNDLFLAETEASPAAMERQSDEEDDLPPLPEDLTRCPKLLKEDCLPRVVIAFKVFDMSVQTNWQPTISDYRTATINKVYEDGTLQLTLAKRDQAKQEVRYDAKTGDRIYGKFDMPGYDEETSEIDTGKFDVPFEELIEPIWIQGSKDSNDEIEQQHADKSRVKPKEILDQGVQEISTIRQSFRLDGGVGEITRLTSIEPNDRARHDVSAMIRDAGWRSSLLPEVNHDLSFNAHDDDDTWQGDVEQDDHSLVDPRLSSTNAFNAKSSLDKRSELSSTSREASQPEHALPSEIAETVPHHNPHDSDSWSMTRVTKTVVEYLTLPMEDDDSTVFQDNRQHRLLSPEQEHEMSSQELLTPSPLHRAKVQRTQTTGGALMKEEMPSGPIGQLDGSYSEEEFPEIFSQAFNDRISQTRGIKIESSDDRSTPELPKLRRQTKSKPKGRLCSSERELSSDWQKPLDEGMDDVDESEIRPSQVQSSLVVDLTISSDPTEHDDSLDDGDDSYRPSSRLPNGSG